MKGKLFMEEKKMFTLKITEIYFFFSQTSLNQRHHRSSIQKFCFMQLQKKKYDEAQAMEDPCVFCQIK